MIVKSWIAVILFFAYLVTAKLGMSYLSLEPGNLTVLWLPSGIALLSVLIFGNYALPFIWIASFYTNFDGLFTSGKHLEVWEVYLADSFSALFDTLQPAIAGYIWRRIIVNNLFTTSDFYKFVLYVTVIPCAIISLLLCSNLYLFGYFDHKNIQSIFQVFVTISLGDTIGILVIVPLYFYWKIPGFDGKKSKFVGLLLLQAILLLVVVYYIPFLYFVSFFILILLGYFNRLKGVSVGIFQLFLFSIIMTKLRVGPFVYEDVFVSYIYLISFLVPFTLLAEFITLLYLIVEHDKFELEKKVLDRTKMLRHEIMERNRAIEALNHSEKLLSESNKTKDKFFSIIAHDLKNPLSGYQQITKILLEDYNKYTDDQRQEILSQIHESSVKLYQLLEHLLDWSRTQSNSMPFHPSLLNLINIVQESLKEIEGKLKLKQIIASVIGISQAFVYADESMIRLVIRNLFSNALKFTAIGGRIDVMITETRTHIVLEFKDTGIGMSEQTLKNLFRIDVPFSEVGLQGERGTGLGLILCKEFINLHHGEIWAKSENGKGTAVSFQLPKNGI
ncbi:MAG: ATP-binding protein [Leptospira sp.]|nr:ATP-binding protein [Leptospira sp.]